jgi:acyl-CoA thioesterase FadM
LERGIKRFEIAYKAESYMGDTLSFYIQPVNDNEIDVEVRKNISEDSNGDVVCQAKVRFNVSDE